MNFVWGEGLLADWTVDISDQWQNLFGELLTCQTRGEPEMMPLSKINTTFRGASINIMILLNKSLLLTLSKSMNQALPLYFSLNHVRFLLFCIQFSILLSKVGIITYARLLFPLHLTCKFTHAHIFICAFLSHDVSSVTRDSAEAYIPLLFSVGYWQRVCSYTITCLAPLF